jgi:hypothetical protein
MRVSALDTRKKITLIHSLEQSPFESRKKPGAQVAHAVPLLLPTQPALHVHWPLLPHTPFRQLHDDGRLATVGIKHLPEPVRPWSHVAQLEGHGWQEGPKNPGEQLSHDWPVNPGAQLHWPEGEHVPVLAHGGEHAADCRSVRLSAPAAVVEGSCAKSGIASQTMMRVLEDVSAAHVFGATRKEPGGSVADV